MAFRIQGNVLACIAPLVCTTVAELVCEVVVVEVNTPHVTIGIFPIHLAIHEDLHRLTTVLQECEQEHSTYRQECHVELHSHTQHRIQEELQVFERVHRE